MCRFKLPASLKLRRTSPTSLKLRRTGPTLLFGLRFQLRPNTSGLGLRPSGYDPTRRRDKTVKHIEASINTHHKHLDNQSKFCCQNLIFYDGNRNSVRFESFLAGFTAMDLAGFFIGKKPGKTLCRQISTLAGSRDRTKKENKGRVAAHPKAAL